MKQGNSPRPARPSAGWVRRCQFGPTQVEIERHSDRATRRAEDRARCGARSLALVSAIACVAIARSSAAQSAGDTVATLELGAPPQDAFILHGTLPIPPGTYPRGDGQDAFEIVDADQSLVPAQTEIVSRYANSDDGADVVELLARVHVPSTAHVGDRIRYDVKLAPHPQLTFQSDPAVRALLAAPDAIVLRTTDVFGNTYSADLYEDANTNSGASRRVLRRGQVAQEIATHETLVPDVVVHGAHGTLPHMMGAHAYVTQWQGEPFFSLDLRVHNAHSGRDHATSIDDPLGKIYFRSIELRLPSGWTLIPDVPDPFFGAPYAEGNYTVWPIVAPIAGGNMHMMPQMSQFERRFAIAPQGSEYRASLLLWQAGIAFSREGTVSSGAPYYSWWNPATARYFPQRQRLPSLLSQNLQALRVADQAALAGFTNDVIQGTAGIYPELSPGLGWAHPWGTQDGGMAGGDEIYLYDGVIAACAASTSTYRLHQLEHRMYTDRQPNVLYDKNGLHTAMKQWVYTWSGGQYIPVWWYNSPMLWASDPFGFNLAPTFQVHYVQDNGLKPDYEDALLGFNPIDEAHLIRYTRNAKVLVWLGNDMLAKDDIRAQAEGFRFAYHMYPQDQWGAIQPTGLLAARTYIDQYPAWGFAYGRGEAWGLDVMCAAYSTQDPQWRAETRAWFGLVADLVRDGQCGCTGIIQSTPLGNIFNGMYRCRQSIECAITENALMAMRASVFEGQNQAAVDEVNQVLATSLYAMISPLVWSANDHGPWAMIAVGLYDQSQPPFCTYWPPDGNYGFADYYQEWSSFAYAYQVTQDPVFLQRAAEMAGGPLAQMFLANPLPNIQNTAALLAMLQMH